MTKKENLLLEVCKMENKLDETRGETPRHDIEALTERHWFYGNSRCFTIYELEGKIKTLNDNIEATLKKQAIEAYFLTEEGAALKAELEAGIKAKHEEIDSLTSSKHDYLRGWIRELLGQSWDVRYLGDRS